MKQTTRGGRLAALSLALLLAAPMAVQALDAPTYSKADRRVRYVDYNPADVIQLDAVIGVATHIVLEPGERYVYHVFGDSKAYLFTQKDNHLFFKPTAEEADTNLIVVTDRRDYAFRLSYHDKRGTSDLYKLVIRYPDSEIRKEAAKAQRQAVEYALRQVGTPVNWKSYTRSGDAALAPVHAWDDGRQTWLQFAPEADIPAVYRVTPDGQEVITNYHMADERTMVLHRTSALWHLRLGDQALAIHNAAYGQVTAPAHTGTASPDVRRVVKGAAPQTLPVANPADLAAPAPTSAQASEAAPQQAAALPVQPPASAPATPVQADADGDLSLMPSRMWEQDGQTWMRFTGSTPTVYTVSDGGQPQEATTTTHPDHTISVVGTASRWQLRQGAASLTISKKDGHS